MHGISDKNKSKARYGKIITTLLFQTCLKTITQCMEKLPARVDEIAWFCLLSGKFVFGKFLWHNTEQACYYENRYWQFSRKGSSINKKHMSKLSYSVWTFFWKLKMCRLFLSKKWSQSLYQKITPRYMNMFTFVRINPKFFCNSQVHQCKIFS